MKILKFNVALFLLISTAVAVASESDSGFSGEQSILTELFLRPGDEGTDNIEMLRDYRKALEFEQRLHSVFKNAEYWRDFSSRWKKLEKCRKMGERRAKQWEAITELDKRAENQWMDLRKRFREKQISNNDFSEKIQGLLNSASLFWKFRSDAKNILRGLKKRAVQTEIAGEEMVRQGFYPPQKAKKGKFGIVWVNSHSAKTYFSWSEITVSQFEQCVTAEKCSKKNFRTVAEAPYCNIGFAERRTHPVNCVNWYGAEEFCRWVGGRLPTNDEWVVEATNGGKTVFPWGNASPSCDLAVMDQNGDGCGRGSTFAVCSKPRGISASGLCDLSGSVWEWTSLCKGHFGALYGGSWVNALPEVLRAGSHSWYVRSIRSMYNGIRCVSDSPITVER